MRTALPARDFYPAAEVEKDAPAFYKTADCVTEKCGVSGEMSGACETTLEVALLEHQEYPDYVAAMRVYDKLTEGKQLRLVERNTASLRKYVVGLFRDAASGTLDASGQEQLRGLLAVLNPFYYHYMVFSDKVPEKVRENVYDAMRGVRALREPLDMVKLFLEFYATENPYAMRVNPTARMDGYLRSKLQIEGAAPNLGSAGRYRDMRVWDLSGKMRKVDVPGSLELDDVGVRSVFSETYGDSFLRPKPLLVGGAGGGDALRVDFREALKMTAEEMAADKDSEKRKEAYALEAQADFLGRLLSREWSPEQRAELDAYVKAARSVDMDKTREKETALVKEVFGSRYVRQVYTFIGTSIFPRFLGVFQVGGLGSPDFEKSDRRMGTEFGLFSYMATRDLYSECNMMHVRGLSDDFSLKRTERDAVVKFLRDAAPEYEVHGYSVAQGVPEGMRYVDPDAGTALSVGFYNASLILEGFVDMALLVEVTRFGGMGKDGGMSVTTEFLVLWMCVGDDARHDVRVGCPVLAEMMMDAIWKDQDVRPTKSALREPEKPDSKTRKWLNKAMGRKDQTKKKKRVRIDETQNMSTA